MLVFYRNYFESASVLARQISPKSETFTMENTVKFKSLIIFYRSLFSILQFNTEIKTTSKSQTKQKLWLFPFQQNYWILILIFSSISTNSIAYYQYWSSPITIQQTILKDSLVIAMSLNVVLTLLSLVPSLIYGKHLQTLWIRFEALNYSIKSKLNHRMNFRNFLKSFKVCGILTFVLYLIGASLRIAADDKRAPFWAPISILNTEILIIYTKMHAIFFIELFCYFFEHFNKYVNLVYHLNSSQMVYHGHPDIIETLKSYTKIYRELCSISRKINAFFGLSFLAYMIQTFTSTAFVVHFFYSQWNNQFLNILSKY